MWEIDQATSRAVWALAERQHWSVTHAQLLALGVSRRAVEHRLSRGRLRHVHQGVYAVGRRQLSREGVFSAAVLACGAAAALSDFSAAELWQIVPGRQGLIHVTVPAATRRRHAGVVVHRRTAFEATRHLGIPVTTADCTLVQLAAAGLSNARLERAVNEATNRDLTDPERLRDRAGAMRRRPGARRIVAMLDRDTFVVTDTRLEQQLVPIAIRAGLGPPQTQRRLGGGRVDFYWPELGLVVEADSLRFHRTPAQQAADALRDQCHHADGLLPLRFTHWQIFHDPGHVEGTLAAVARRLRPS